MHVRGSNGRSISRRLGPCTARHDMTKACESCGNTYDKAFEVMIGGTSHTFDSFACAIHALAPSCAHCGCRIIGHGIDGGTKRYCCAHCARESGETEAVDNTAHA